MRSFRASALISLLFLLTPSFFHGQDATGRVIGNVVDQQGAVVGGAKVTVTDRGTQISHHTMTGKDGYFQVLDLPIGTYYVTIEHEGFNRSVTQDQKLLINQSLRFDITLAVGAANQTVTVEAQVSGVETENSTLGGSVTSRELVNLPLNGRDVLTLALLQPGVTEADPDYSGANSGTSYGGFSIAGNRPDSVTYLLDGGLNNDLLDNSVVLNPNPDTVAEFRILTSNYSAEYGRNAGGVISVVTKSGTNEWHGSAFEFVRNGAFNANSFFNNLNGITRDNLKRNQFGGTIGGPIEIPHLIQGKDRFFFFVGYQGQRLTQTQNPSTVFPGTPSTTTSRSHRSVGRSSLLSSCCNIAITLQTPARTRRRLLQDEAQRISRRDWCCCTADACKPFTLDSGACVPALPGNRCISIRHARTHADAHARQNWLRR